HIDLARVAESANRPTDTEAEIAAALAIYEALARDQPDDPIASRELAVALQKQGRAQLEREDPAAAATTQAAIDRLDRVLASEPRPIERARSLGRRRLARDAREHARQGG